MNSKDESYFLPHAEINNVLAYLQQKGYCCLGPQVKDEAVIYAPLQESQQLPWGIRDHQTPGQYRLEKTDIKRAFAWANGPQAVKPLLFNPRETLFRVVRNAKGKLSFQKVLPTIQPTALFGIRSCDLAAMAIQDTVFQKGVYPDKHYQLRRESLFIIVVSCSYSGNNCFCVSTNTGPTPKNNLYDLVWTEIENGFVIASNSDAGQCLINKLNLAQASSEMQQLCQSETQQAIDMQHKKMPLNNSRAVHDLLMNNLDHPRWDDVAARCLSCGNCTSVCPTCFCHHQTEQPALDGKTSEHNREWDSCFSADFSHIHGKTIREDTKSRYKQWLTHKLGTWWEQFDSSGCVGCGRCVTWCPVGIDLTEEVAAIAKEEP